MCQYKSGIILKTGRVIIELDTDSHSEIIEKHKLREGHEVYPWANFVSVECTPKGDMFSKDRKDWTFRLDDNANPEWFVEQSEQLKDAWFEEMFRVLAEKERILNETGHWGGDLSIYSEAKLDAPKLESVGGGLFIYSEAKLDALKSIGGGLFINSEAKLDAPKLESVGGDLSIYSEAKLDAPKLESVGGDLYIHSEAKLDAPKLSKVNGKPYKKEK